jgi:hypothetical protein
MIGGSEFKSAGTELNRMMDKLGFPDQVGDVYGAALDAAIGDNSGVARNLLDAYSPFTTSQLDSLTRTMSPAAFMRKPEHSYAFRNPMQGFNKIYSAGFPTPALGQQIVNSLLSRVSPQNFAPVLNQLNSGVAPAAGQSLPDALGSTMEMMLDRMVGNLERKIDAQEVQAPPKKKKKKGIGSKIGKAFKKIKKSVTSFPKKAFSSVLKTLNKPFSTFWNALRSGNIFQLGQAFTGGLIGGPVSGLMMDQVMKLAGKKNPLTQVFKQVHGTFDMVSLFQKNQADLQRALFQKFLR